MKLYLDGFEIEEDLSIKVELFKVCFGIAFKNLNFDLSQKTTIFCISLFKELTTCGVIDLRSSDVVSLAPERQ